MNILNMPSEESVIRIASAIETIGKRMGVSGDVNTWEDVQRIVRMGKAEEYFAVGDQFLAEYNGFPIVWDVIGINHDKPSDPKMKNSLTIQAHDCLFNAQFSAPQVIAHVTNELPAGEQILTYNGNQYKFTTTKTIPAKGVILVTSWNDYVPLVVSTYNSGRITVLEAGITVEAVESGTDTITKVNDRVRARYGSNNYKESAIRQFLNSDEVLYKFKAMTDFDMPSLAAPYTGAGFLSLLDPELADVIGRVNKPVARNTVTDGGGQDIVADKVFLLSVTEVYSTPEGVTTGEVPYDYYSLMAVAPTVEAVDWRIKYLAGSPRNWWLRSPSVGTSHYPRNVHTTGLVYHGYYAHYANGVSPACVII